MSFSNQLPKGKKKKKKAETKKSSSLDPFVVPPTPTYIEQSSRYFLHVVRSGVH